MYISEINAKSLLLVTIQIFTIPRVGYQIKMLSNNVFRQHLAPVVCAMSETAMCALIFCNPILNIVLKSVEH